MLQWVEHSDKKNNRYHYDLKWNHYDLKWRSDYVDCSSFRYIFLFIIL